MQHRILTAVFFLLALVLALPAFAQAPNFIGEAPSNPLTAALVDQEKTLVTASLHHDATALGRLLTDDFVFINYDGHNTSKGELFGDGDLKQYTIYDPQTLTLNDGAVLLSYNAIVRQTVSDDETHIPRYQHVTTIWVKQGTEWKQKFHQTAALQVGS
jgi:hypothetical protein